MSRTKRIALTALVAFTLLVMLAGMLALVSMIPLLVLPAIVALAVNGFAAADVIGKVWGLRDQVPDCE